MMQSLNKQCRNNRMDNILSTIADHFASATTGAGLTACAFGVGNLLYGHGITGSFLMATGASVAVGGIVLEALVCGSTNTRPKHKPGTTALATIATITEITAHLV